MPLNIAYKSSCIMHSRISRNKIIAAERNRKEKQNYSYHKIHNISEGLLSHWLLLAVLVLPHGHLGHVKWGDIVAVGAGIR